MSSTSVSSTSVSSTEEGVIKYVSSHTTCSLQKALPAGFFASEAFSEAFAELDATRTILHDLRLIGVTSTQGGTIGYGNISLRVQKDTFLISGSGTGASRILGLEGYSLVHAFNPEENRVESLGLVQASSESMTHGAIYRANPALCCVIHVHNRELFDRLLAQGWAHTPESVTYGTPELSRSVATLVRTLPKIGGVFVTAGHAEGLFACGVSISNARDALVHLNKKGSSV